MTQPTAQNIHTATLLYIYDNTLISPNIITSLHTTSPPIFHFPALLDVSSPPFKNPSLLLTYNHLPNPFSKNMLFTGDSRQSLCRQFVPQFDCPTYKGNICRYLRFVS